MNIKTITCHHAYNYGASLQAHALMYVLSKNGDKVEIINYIPSYVKDFNSIWFIGERYRKNFFMTCAYYAYVIPIRLLQYKKKRLFEKYDQEYLRLTKKYESFAELQTDPPAADVIFCGSDQIWNTATDNGLDPSYYAAFARQETVRASYAASFSISKLSEEHKPFVRQMLGGMRAISVREKTGIDILQDLGFNKAVQVVDPVFLPEVEHWFSMTKPIKDKDYVLVYDQENSPVIKQIAQGIAKKHNLKIIAFRDLYPRLYANKTVWNTGPIEFISLIRNASFVVTNSFHCTAFSILFKREFVIVPRTHEKVNSRMMDLVISLGLNDRYLKSAEDINNIKPIDFETVYEEIEKLRSSSYSFIDKTLKIQKLL